MRGTQRLFTMVAPNGTAPSVAHIDVLLCVARPIHAQMGERSCMSPKKIDKKTENRVPLLMSDAELEAFDKARAKAFPLADRSKVLRALIEKFVKETKT
jgi:hypothetical protein